jgi:hypothetical protein
MLATEHRTQQTQNQLALPLHHLHHPVGLFVLRQPGQALAFEQAAWEGNGGHHP